MYTHADNDVGVTAAVPEQLLDTRLGSNLHLAADDQNEMTMLSLNGVGARRRPL